LSGIAGASPRPINESPKAAARRSVSLICQQPEGGAMGRDRPLSTPEIFSGRPPL